MYLLILPINRGMTSRKATEFCQLKAEVTEHAVFFEIISENQNELVDYIKTVCPNCGSTNIVPVILFRGKGSHELVEQKKALLIPVAYDVRGVSYNNYGCLDCDYRWLIHKVEV